MRRINLYQGLILFGIGAIGILLLLGMEIPMPDYARKALAEKFTPSQIKLVLLINPTIMLAIATIVGSLLHKKVKLEVPIINGFLQKKLAQINISSILSYGIVGGVISGILLSLTAAIFYPILPSEFIELGEKLKPTLALRFLYGGFTEEIMMRFGLLTFVVWFISLLSQQLKDSTYWISIFVAAFIFALGHFPVAFLATDSPSTGLMAYLLIGNSIGGIIFGWLYWKKGLECAFIAHIFTHVILVISEPLLN